MIALVLLGLFLAGALFFRALFQRPLTSFEWIFAYPVGLALTGLYLFLGWLALVPFWLLTAFWWFSLVLGVLFGWKQWHFEREVQDTLRLMTQTIRQGIRELFESKPPFSHWPLLYMGAVVGVAALVVLAWQIAFPPLSWDSLALYDFRAQRVVEGWQIQDFARQFTRMPEYQAYDFLHPITSSLWWALVYQSGGAQVLMLYSALLFTVVLAGWSVWKTWSARVVWSFLWLSLPAVFVSLTEGYGAYPANLYWALFGLWFFGKGGDQLNELQRWQPYLVAGLCILGSVSGRVTEYYWLGVLLVSSGILAYFGRHQMVKTVKNFMALWLLPLISVGVWLGARSWAVQVSGASDEDRSIVHLVQSLWDSGLAPVWTALQAEFAHWIFSPLLPWLVLVAVGVWMFWRTRRQWPRLWSVWGVMLVVNGGILLAGMVALHIVFGERWEEARQAMDRAIMPLLALIFMWLADLTNRFFLSASESGTSRQKK